MKSEDMEFSEEMIKSGVRTLVAKQLLEVANFESIHFDDNYVVTGTIYKNGQPHVFSQSMNLKAFD
jgi:hypothetical protein